MRERIEPVGIPSVHGGEEVKGQASHPGGPWRRKLGPHEFDTAR